MPNDDLTPSQEAAAFHGLATNSALHMDERLAMALQALDMYEAEVKNLPRRAIADLRAERDRLATLPSMSTTFLQGFGSAIRHLESKVASDA